MAVAVINWNTRKLLRRCLATVAAERPTEVVVVDNGSTDGSVEMVRAEFPAVRLEHLPGNPGYGAAANIAFSLCDAEYVLLLNSDTELRGGTLLALTAHLDRCPRAGIAGPRLLNPDGTLQQSTFPFPSPVVPLLKRLPLADLVSGMPGLRDAFVGTWAHDHARRVPWVLGAALAIRRTAYEAIGGFDESYVMYYEEVDLCYRLRQAGWETHFTPATEVMHVGGASTSQRRPEMLAQLSLSAMEFHRRHHRGMEFAVAMRLLRTTMRYRLCRDWLGYQLLRRAPARRVFAENLAVWREVLDRSSRAA
ncbi:MAG TPA: glycosyltransferase family 2 protein [Gemmatimonadales bacterium]|nr:glycosyltransferase family 2 protein [Gemmatimonadales bacterium]